MLMENFFKCNNNNFSFHFLELHFVAVEGKEVHSGNIEDVPIKEKSKFPQDFFPEVVYQLNYFYT